jgi:pyroglutamyl-peptidase
MPVPARRLLAAVSATRLPATQSHDAGRYLCNYLAWRTATAAGNMNGPQLAAFVHVPKVALRARRPGKGCKFTLNDLTRAGIALLAVVAGVCHVSDGKRS